MRNEHIFFGFHWTISNRIHNSPWINTIHCVLDSLNEWFWIYISIDKRNIFYIFREKKYELFCWKVFIWWERETKKGYVWAVGTISLWFIGAWNCFVDNCEIFYQFLCGQFSEFWRFFFFVRSFVFQLKMLWLMLSMDIKTLSVRHNGCNAWANIHVVMCFLFFGRVK